MIWSLVKMIYIKDILYDSLWGQLVKVLWVLKIAWGNHGSWHTRTFGKKKAASQAKNTQLWDKSFTLPSQAIWRVDLVNNFKKCNKKKWLMIMGTWMQNIEYSHRQIDAKYRVLIMLLYCHILSLWYSSWLNMFPSNTSYICIIYEYMIGRQCSMYDGHWQM